jgi:D-alanyl-D-alanine carboxypeptidase
LKQYLQLLQHAIYPLPALVNTFASQKKQKLFMHNKTGAIVSNLRNWMLLALTVLFFSCSKSDNNNGSSSAITNFSFLQSANSIPVNSYASINGNNINIFLPPGTNTNALIANFTLSDSGIVRVGGTAQTSGSTANNFSGPITYTVTGTSGAVQTYTVNLTTGIGSIDQNVAAFMTQYNVPAMSIAITLNEKLVYVKAYGKSDVAGNQAAIPQNLYRISSLSKQLTSVAIMKLMDQGKIHMSDKVFGSGAILGTDYGTQPYGPGVSDITIDELLHHTEGGWPDNTTDPLGTNPSFSTAQILTWGLDNVPLLTTPGTPASYYYSHFGYFILGRVIEKITGMPYATAVQSLVLQPSGISDMQIAGNTIADRLPNEVTYYGQNGSDPYSFNINRMDAANGWVASATDLARFLVHVDGLSNLTFLSPNAVTVMSTGSIANKNYACGWEINQYNWFHHGSLPGTGTSQAITTQSGNFNYVILANSNSSDPNFQSNMDNIFWSSLSPNMLWPSYDLFVSNN